MGQPVGLIKLNSSIKAFIVLFFFSFTARQICMQESGIWQQKSSSSKIEEAQSELVDAWFRFRSKTSSYNEYKKTTKKAIRVLGFTQFIHKKSNSMIDPLFYAALQGDYTFMLSLLKKSANPNLSQLNLIKVIEGMDTKENNPTKDKIIFLLRDILN